MKKLLLMSIVLVSFIATGSAQSTEFSTLCDKYRKTDGVKTFRINGLGCFMASLFVGGEDSAVGPLVRGCSACQILVYDGDKGQELSKEIKSYIRSNTLEELLTVKEDEEEVKIYAEEQKNKIRQFFLTVTDGSEMVYIHLKGKFSKANLDKNLRFLRLYNKKKKPTSLTLALFRT